MLLQVYRKAALEMVTDKKDAIQVSLENLQTYVGKPLFTKERMYDITPPGVVTGLAWTAMGELSFFIKLSNVSLLTSLITERMHNIAAYMYI